MAALVQGGERGGVVLSHSCHVVELVLNEGGEGVIRHLPWSQDVDIVACAVDCAGEAAVACTSDKRVIFWGWVDG